MPVFCFIFFLPPYMEEIMLSIDLVDCGMYEEKTLNFLNTVYPNRVELLDFFLAEYPDAPKETLEDIRVALYDLYENKKLIEIYSDDYCSLGKSSRYPTSQHNTDKYYECVSFNDLKNIKDTVTIKDIIKAKITDAGIRELRNLEFQQQLFNVNETVIVTNRNLRNAGWWTVGISSIAALFAILGFFKGDSELQQQTHKLLQQKLLQLDSISQSQKGIDSSLRKAVKDSLHVYL